MRGAALVLALAAAAGMAVWLLVWRKGSAGDDQMYVQMAGDIERGGLADLGRAQALGRHLVLANPRDRQAAAALAFTSAMLAIEYGLDTAAETAEALAHVDGKGSKGNAGDDDDPAVIAAAAHALSLLQAGDRNLAGRLATEAAGASDLPHPLYALGRTRARGGDLPGAARALEAAMIRAPGFTPARVAWAELHLDLGDLKTARTALDALSAQPSHAARNVRVELLLDEAATAAGDPAPPTSAPDGLCASDHWLPRAVTASCALARAARARRGGDRRKARPLAESAADAVPDEPRLLARTALALCQLGAIDRAAALVDRARRLEAPTSPLLAWAAAAGSLGRGRAGALPAGPRPVDPELRLLIARASLAAGGVGALSSTLEELGPATRADADLTDLTRLRHDKSEKKDKQAANDNPEAAPALADDDPARAFVDGLQARLDGKLDDAARRLARALSGHADACRAAGEYRATLRALKQRPDPAVFESLRAENAGCVNLPRP